MRENTIHQSLLLPQQVLGVEQNMAVAIWMVTLGAVFVMHFIFMLPVGILTHAFFAWLYKDEDYLLDVYKEYMRQGDVYDPWVRSNCPVTRPDGWHKDLLC